MANPYGQSQSDYQKYLAMMQQQYYAPSSLGALGSALGLSPIDATRTTIDPKKIDALKKVEPRKVTARMPDGFVPGVSWRAWKVAAPEGSWRLFALGSTEAWEPKKAMQAVCNAHAEHPAPNRDCNCGIWSFQTLDKLIPALKQYEVVVLGQVSIWGRIIETENGFRSQFAYPKELWLLDNSMEELGYIYGVPIRTLEAK